jgi:hypothetical protein
MEVLPHCRLSGPAEEIRVLQLTDMHLFPEGSTAWFCSAKGTFAPRLVDFEREGFEPIASSATAEAFVSGLVEHTRPHIVVLTGDIVDGRPFGDRHPAFVRGSSVGHPRSSSAVSLFSDAFLAALRPLLQRGIPWCFIPGNHDDDGSPWTRHDLLQVFALPGCATPSATCFDHTLTIGFGPCSDEQSVRLWLFDSGPNRPRIK